MGSIVPDDTDFREHVAELGVLHIERDNRLPRAWNIVAKLISGILRLVSGEEHDIRANPQNASIVHAVVPDFLHPLGYRTAKGIASPTRRDNAVLDHISWRILLALVQTFGINATKRSGTLRGSCGENSIPDFWRPIVFDAKLSEFELTFPDPMHEFNAGDGDRGALKALQSEHWTQTKFDRPVILLDQIVIWHV